MPAFSQSTVRVEGLRELSRAFSLADKAERKLFRDALRDAAEPVRAEAEALAVSRITRIGLDWSRMRVGVTRTSVYVAPRSRGVRGISARKRRNLAPLLMDRAMQPALDSNVGDVIERTDEVLTQVSRLWGNA